MLIRRAQPGDAEDWEHMRQRLWPTDDDEHARAIAAFFADDQRDPAEVFLAFDAQGHAIGFAEVSIRPYAEGCYSGRVAYLEGWYVEPAYRRRGVGAALVGAVEDWGRAEGCPELGSDAEIENVASAAAHHSLGFSEVGRVVCFRKPL